MTTARSTGTSADRQSLVMRSAVAPGLVAAMGCTIIALAVAGTPGLFGALVGAACVLGFFGFGQLVLEVFRSITPSMLLVIALMTYLLQVVALLAVYALFQDNPKWQQSISTTSLAVTAMVCTMIWMAGLVHAARRERIPLFETSESR